MNIPEEILYQISFYLKEKELITYSMVSKNMLKFVIEKSNFLKLINLLPDSYQLYNFNIYQPNYYFYSKLIYHNICFDCGLEIKDKSYLCYSCYENFYNVDSCLIL